MRESPLTSREFSTEVSVDLLAASRDVVVCLQGLVLTPVDKTNTAEPVICLAVAGDVVSRIELSEPRPNKSNSGRPFRVTIAGQLTTGIESLGDLPSVEATKVRIATTVYGLSFLDVLAANRVMPESMFGGEFSGVVTAAGDRAGSRLAVGDRVMAVCGGGFASHIDIDANLVAAIPDSLSFSDAATIPVSVCTALFALDRARVRAGQTVLVHNASGALGTAVVMVIRHQFGDSVKIVATCSRDPKKRAVVGAHGVDIIVDSRDVSSWPHALEGIVHASIGAMHGELLPSTLVVMASFGIIVDVGKRLQTENTLLGLAPFVRGLTYTTAHLDELMRVDPRAVLQLLEQAVSIGLVLPYKSYPLDRIDEALKFLSSGTHTGKVVIDMPATAMMERDDPMTRVDFAMDVKSTSQMSIVEEVGRIFSHPVNVIVGQFDGLSSSTQSTAVLVHPKVTPDMLIETLKRVPVMDLSVMSIVVLPESALLGSEPVEPTLRHIRSELLSSLAVTGDVKQTESSWLKDAIAKVIGTQKIGEKELDLSMEQLGIDSLGRLQLWHAFRRQFPHSRLASQFAANLPLRSVLHISPVSEPVHERKQRWLALHGFRTSASFFEHQLSGLAEMFSDMDIEYIDAPHVARGPCPYDSEGFEWWWGQQDTSYENGWVGDGGLDESIEFIERKVQETGPYAGVIGFSQGGGMALHLVASGLVDRAILFSPVVPSGRDWPSKIHETGYKAIVIRDMNDHSVDGFPTDGMAVITHSEMHVIPTLGGAIVDAITTLMQ